MFCLAGTSWGANNNDLAPVTFDLALTLHHWGSSQSAVMKHSAREAADLREQIN
jgi:hypothetical protein